MLFWYFWCFTLFLYSQPVWSWLSLLYNISSRNIKRKTHQSTILLGHALYCTIRYCKYIERDRNEINGGCKAKKERKKKKLKQTNMLVSAGCELVVIDDKCPIIRDLESPISSAVILQICILNWPCSVAAQCTVSGVFTETGLI